MSDYLQSMGIELSTLEYLDRLDRFIEDHVRPAEADVSEDDLDTCRVEEKLLPELRDVARDLDLYAPQLPAAGGGQGLGVVAVALISERCGPHPLASLALNCTAPDEANLHLLLRYGTASQQERFLEPLAAGRIRSCFGMTEPDAGSDPRRIRSTAVRTDSGWCINANKVFTTGARGAAFCVVMAITDPDVSPGRGISMFIVPTDAPGFRVVRELHTMGFHTLGGHPEILLEDVEVGDDHLLGQLGAGFAMAQSRLSVGRLGHAMRWIGIAQRALDLAAEHALHRETFGEPLADRQAIQWWLADGATKLYAARLMVFDTCRSIEAGEEERTKVAMVKTTVSETLGEIVDHALQVFGGWGYTTDLPLERFYRDARAARIYDGPSEVHRMSIARRVLKEVESTGSSRVASGDPIAAARNRDR